MSTDYAAWEQEFLSSLKEDTGRDLAEWMALISAQNFKDKNDIIDWLRHQGFMFSKASWLERVHHNAGKPVYGDAPHARPPVLGPVALPPARPAPLPDSRPSVEIAPVPAPQPAPPAEAMSEALASELDALLAKGKALRPLAQFILRETQRAVPGTTIEARSQYVSMTAGHEFAVLLIGPRELKLGLSLAAHPFSEPLKPAKFAAPGPRVSPRITHVAALDDARQVNPRLLDAIKLAAKTES